MMEKELTPLRIPCRRCCSFDGLLERERGKFLREPFAHPLAHALAQSVITRIRNMASRRDIKGREYGWNMSSSDLLSTTRDETMEWNNVRQQVCGRARSMTFNGWITGTHPLQSRWKKDEGRRTIWDME
jgi:hypothetical protein